MTQLIFGPKLMISRKDRNRILVRIIKAKVYVEMTTIKEITLKPKFVGFSKLIHGMPKINNL